MSDYTDAAGMIQFPPTDKDLNGKKIREVVINSIKTGAQIRCTIWDGFAHVLLKQGDVIFANGKATQNKGTKADGTEVVYNNLSVTRLAVLPSEVAVETERVANAATPNVNDVF